MYKDLLAALEKNNMKGIFAKTREDVLSIVKNMLFDGAVLSHGGSVTLAQTGITDLIRRPEYRFLDRNREGMTPEEKQQVFKDILGCDIYFTSANAVTLGGELINVDGFANRITAITFGPQKVVAVVGKNKIVSDIKEGFLRVKRTAAPKNCVRLGIDTPCSKLGHCISLQNNPSPDITDGCSHERRICRNYLITANQSIKDRITVIICNEELGY